VTERLNLDDDATAPIPPPEGAPIEGGRVAKVNLLPPEIERERRRHQIALISLGVLGIYLIALMAVYVAKSNAVADALAERDAADRRVAVLQSDLDELSEFQTLVDDIDARESLLTAAMDDELSWARVFGDLALSFSRDSSLTQIQAATAEDAAPEGDIAAADADPEPEPDADTSVAQVTFTGYSVEEFAPGVAEVLADFAEAEGFFDSYLTTAIEEERGDSEVTGFEGRVELNDKAYTRRYEDGLPEESLQ
jgi:hypothetical protein